MRKNCYSDEFGRARDVFIRVDPRTSRAAMGSLLCGVLMVVPLIGIAGVILGRRVLATIAHDPRWTGRRLARNGILLSVLGLVVQAFAIFQLIGFADVAVNGPRFALIAGFTGDPAGFRSLFHGVAAEASDAEVEAFIETLRERYGLIDQADCRRVLPLPRSIGTTVLPFELRFAKDDVAAEVEMVFARPALDGLLVHKLTRIRVIDPRRGDVSFPATTAGPLVVSGGSGDVVP